MILELRHFLQNTNFDISANDIQNELYRIAERIIK